MVYVFHFGGGLQSPHPLIRFLGYLTQTGWIGVVLFFALSGFLITGILWDSLLAASIGFAKLLRPPYRSESFPLYLRSCFCPLSCFLAFSTRQHASASSARLSHLCALFLQNMPVLADQANARTSHGRWPVYHLWSARRRRAVLPPLARAALGSPTGENPTIAAARCNLTSLDFCPRQKPFALHRLWLRRLQGLPSTPRTIFDSFLLHPRRCSRLWAAALAICHPQRFGPRPSADLQNHRKMGRHSRSSPESPPTASPAERHCPHPVFLQPAPAIHASACPAVRNRVRRADCADFSIPGLPYVPWLRDCAALRWLGRISYGFYIFHMLLKPLFDYARRRTHSRHQSGPALIRPRAAPSAFPITTLVAWLSFRYQLIERQFLQQKQRISPCTRHCRSCASTGPHALFAAL